MSEPLTSSEADTPRNWRVIVYDENGRVLRQLPLTKRTKAEADTRGKALFESITGADSFVVEPC